MLCALIMAGGVGSRFWPKSTEKKPKQFLKLVSNDKTMLQLTYDRMNKLISSDNIFIVTNEKYVEQVKENIPGINDINIITEPCSKNTEPCILLSALYLKNIKGDCNIVCVSSDSYIRDEDEFIKKVELANDLVTKNKESIVTIGIKPTRPETGYGYIKYEKTNEDICKVSKFVEKPIYEVAKEYFISGEYLWNAGMFIFNNDSMLKEIEHNDPDNYNTLKDLPKVDDSDYKEFLNTNYQKCNKISIDYAVMEKSKNVYTVPSDIGWDDVGTWESLERYRDKDINNNIISGEVNLVNSSNNIIYSHNKKIIVMDLEGIFCIDSDDVIIIGKKENINDVLNYRD